MGLVMNLPDRPPAPRRWDSSRIVADLTGATYRQIDYWARHGLLGRRHQDPGSGQRRSFTPADCELVHALVLLAALGCVDRSPGRGGSHPRGIERAVDAVRAGRVHAAGERLVVPLDGTAYRMRLAEPMGFQGAGWVIPLRPITEADMRAEAAS